MPSLEHRIPPPVLGLFTALAMWLLSLVLPVMALPMAWRIAIALLLALGGGAVSLTGVISFRRARTTVNPLKPERASTLVTSGIYRVTRNPMYLGMLMVLLGWLAFLACPLALIGPVFFYTYIDRFQIRPEERVLTGLFGATYADFCQRVRRWI